MIDEVLGTLERTRAIAAMEAALDELSWRRHALAQRAALLREALTQVRTGADPSVVAATLRRHGMEGLW